MIRKKSTLFQLFSLSLIFLFFTMIDSGAQVTRKAVIDKNAAVEKFDAKKAEPAKVVIATRILGFSNEPGQATKLKGDNDIYSKKNERTLWELRVDLVPKDKDSSGSYRSIDVKYVYSAKEDKKDWTHLELRGTKNLPLDFGLLKLEGPASQTVSGTITGEQHNFVSVSVPANNIIKSLQVRVDSKGDDRSDIGFKVELNVQYTEGPGSSSAKPTGSGSLSVISTQPSNKSIEAGSKTTFSVAASNASSYQWWISTNKGASWAAVSNSAPYSGATSKDLTITNATTSMNNYMYCCAITNSAGINYSNAATLTVRAATADPSSGMVKVNFMKQRQTTDPCYNMNGWTGMVSLPFGARITNVINTSKYVISLSEQSQKVEYGKANCYHEKNANLGPGGTTSNFNGSNHVSFFIGIQSLSENPPEGSPSIEVYWSK